MAGMGYRCVKFDDLCRLCSNAAEKNVQIFSNGDLQKKIIECLPISLSDKDKLPKKICIECKEYVEIFSEFRKSTQNAQKLLEGCLNTTKLRNGGQVYIRDEAPIKKVLKPIQKPSPNKIIPNLSPVQQIKKNVITSPNQNDLISSIMQAVGIQAGEDTESTSGVTQSNVNVQQQQASLQNLPQYTLTFDGGVIKPGQIQYKLENTNNYQSPLIAAANEEFLKLKQKPGIIIKKEPQQLRLTTTNATTTDDVPNKKPKINLVLQTTPQKQQAKVQSSQVLTSPTNVSSFTSPSKAQILNIEKLMPVTSQKSPSKHPILMPIMVRSDGSRNSLTTATATGADFLQQAFQLSSNQTAENKPNQPFMLMKIQSNSDGQLTLMPAAAPAPPIPQPQQLQISLSPQQLQQLGIQTISTSQSQLQTQTVNVQPAQLPNPPPVTTTTPALVQPQQREIQTQTKDLIEDPKEDDNFMDSYDDDCDDMDNESFNESNENIAVEIKSSVSTSKRKITKSGKSNKMKTSDLYEEPVIDPVHSEQAKKQLTQLTNFNTKKNGEESDEKSDINLTVCDVCKKTFKRKEFLMQHLKSHIGIRPFKCSEPTCNKSFSRKEHLLRHVSSHTGRKEFECNVCRKMFSRKDNLNKHRRIHPETTGQSSSLRHNCTNCNKGFGTKAQLQKHHVNCSGKSSETTEFIKTIKTSPPAKKAIEGKKMEIKNELQPPKLVQVLQPQPQIKNEPPMFKTIYTLPANFILNSNGTISTTTSTVVGDMANVKFDNP